MTHEVIIPTDINQIETIYPEGFDYLSVPLYLRPDGCRGEKQTLDLPTVEFMYSQAFGNEEPPITLVSQVLATYVPQEWENVVPDRKFYPDQIHYDSVHGAEHSAIVGTYVELTGQAFDLTQREINMLKRVAYKHDFFRDRDDDPDTGHGARAATWYLEEESAEELRDDFSNEERLIIAEISQYHDLPWEQVLIETDPRNLKMHLAFRLADALERYRIDKKAWQPQAERMHFPESVNPELLLLFAKKFSISVRLRRLRDGLSIEEAIKQESIATGLILPDSNSEKKNHEYVLNEGEEIFL